VLVSDIRLKLRPISRGGFQGLKRSEVAELELGHRALSLDPDNRQLPLRKYVLFSPLGHNKMTLMIAGILQARSLVH